MFATHYFNSFDFEATIPFTSIVFYFPFPKILRDAKMIIDNADWQIVQAICQIYDLFGAAFLNRFVQAFAALNQN